MNTVKVLDHGFVKLRNIAGPTRRIDQAFDASDVDVANSARMSFDSSDGERTYEDEMRLNRYLLLNKHMTPFESIEVWLEMKLPIFVARQFVRHRTATIDEVSARYMQLPDEWYIPALEDVVLQSKDKKQGGKPVDLTNPMQVRIAGDFREVLNDDCLCSYEHYKESIAQGIAMEQARMHLHVNHYTHWLWKQDLRNLFGTLVLRDHTHAQGEAQAYARGITNLIEPHIPGLVKLYNLIMKGEEK